MGATAVVDGLKVTVIGDPGRADLVVPWLADVHDIAEAYAETFGLRTPPALSLRSGEALEPDAGVESVGLSPGALLIAGASTAVPAGSGSADAAPICRDVTGAPRWVPWLAGTAAIGAAAVVGPGLGETLRLVTVAVLMLGAVAGMLSGRHQDRAPVAPLFAGAAAYAAVQVGGEGDVLLGLAAGGLCAAAAAAIMGAWGSEGCEEHNRVWLTTGFAVAALAAGFLLFGLEPHNFWPSAFLAALIVARFAPSLALDVPDQALIDIERLAVTAWSPREQRRGRRGRSLVRQSAVRELQRSGQRLVEATVLACAVTVGIAAPAMMSSVDGLAGWGAFALSLLGGAALVLIGRLHRAPLARRLMRFSGVWCIAVAGVSFVLGHGGVALVVVALCCVVIGACTVVAAVAVGRGWRSVRWSRWGEIAESLTVAFAIGAVPLATGLFDHVRALVS